MVKAVRDNWPGLPEQVHDCPVQIVAVLFKL